MPKHKILTNPEVLKYTGMYEDGWTFSNVTFELKQPNKPADLVVSGVVPQLEDKKFNTELTVKLDGREVNKATLTPGEFNVRLSCLTNAVQRKLELKFAKTQSLSKDDKRMIGALLNKVGFESPATDIFMPAGGIELGKNWHPAEKWAGETFRWVTNDAEIALTASGQLKLEIEPGPSLGSQPFELEVLDSKDNLLTKVLVKDRNPVPLALPKGSDHIKLHVGSESQKAPGETRILNFRVFQIFLS